MAAIEDLQAQCGRAKREFAPPPAASSELTAAAKILGENRLREILRDSSLDKVARDVAVQNVRASVVEEMKQSFPDADFGLLSDVFNKSYKELFRKMIFEDDTRFAPSLCANSHQNQISVVLRSMEQLRKRNFSCTTSHLSTSSWL